MVDLRALVKNCNNRNTTSVILRDQIVLGVADSGVRKRLLFEKDQTLDHATKSQEHVSHPNLTCLRSRHRALKLKNRTALLLRKPASKMVDSALETQKKKIKNRSALTVNGNMIMVAAVPSISRVTSVG